MRSLSAVLLLVLASLPAAALDAEPVDVGPSVEPAPPETSVESEASVDASVDATVDASVDDASVASGAEATVDAVDADATASAGVDAEAPDAAVETGLEVDAGLAAGNVSLEAGVGPDAGASGGGADGGAADAATVTGGGTGGSSGTAPRSDLIDEPAPSWRFDAASEVQTAAVAVPLAAGGAAAVSAAVAPHATGRALLRVGRWLALVPLWGLFSRVSDDAMDDQPARRAIMAYVQENPGASIQDVRGMLDVAWGTAVYHLRRLEDAERLVSERQGRLHRYWVRNDPSAQHRDAQAVVQSDTARSLLAAVAARPGSRQKDLCALVGCSAPVASKYLGRMAREDLVTVVVAGRDRLYHLGQGARLLPGVVGCVTA